MKIEPSELKIISDHYCWIHNANEKAQNFNCGNSDLNNYVVKATSLEVKEQKNTITIGDVNGNMAGFISYTISKITPGSSSSHEEGYPYLIIEYFAVDDKYKGNKIGQQLMLEVIKTTAEIFRWINIHGIYLTALSSAVSYYEDKFGFENLNPYLKYNNDSNVYIPMKLDILAVLDIAFEVDK